jgi:hypothetical protein
MLVFSFILQHRISAYSGVSWKVSRNDHKLRLLLLLRHRNYPLQAQKSAPYSRTKAMAGVPVIQVLSRSNYEDQHMVALPKAYPLPALPPSSLRVKTAILSLTTNNFSYAKVGHLLGWWDIHLLPESIPTEYADPKKFGRISGWGFGDVIESNVPEVEVGTQLFGYLPIGTLPVDFEVQVDQNVPNQLVVTSKHRQHVLPIYNRYIVFQRPKDFGDPKFQHSQGYDSLMYVYSLISCLQICFLAVLWTFSLINHMRNGLTVVFRCQAGVVRDKLHDEQICVRLGAISACTSDWRPKRRLVIRES